MVYRPNQAKVKNLKTKDYLGKARLVAASDRANAFTGFAGSEIKNVSFPSSSTTPLLTIKSQAGKLDVKDDRPPESLSFAATNLVKPGLSSKRQQSEPPLNRNVFPPTPPPEAEKGSQMSRGASVRNGPKPAPARLNLASPPARTNSNDFPAAAAEEAPRMRSASEVRGPPSRGYSTREPSRSRPPPQRRTTEEEDDYPGELYDMYSGGSRQSQPRPGQGRSRQQPAYIEEEDEYASDYDADSFDENDFQMMNSRPPASSSGRGPRAPSSSGRGQSRRPEIRKIRVKVHAAEDVRYIMIGTAVEYPDLTDRIREKFGLKRRFKIKVKDDDESNGDMITMGDQDDLEMAVQSVKDRARRERQDMGKMEVSSFTILLLDMLLT